MSGSVDHHVSSCEYSGGYVYSDESAKSHRHDSIATVEDADMKLGRCAVWTKMQVEFEDGCGINTW